MKRIWLVYVILYIALVIVACQAEIIRVPQDALNIQAGIDMALDGDLVQVSQGIYSGLGNTDIDFSGKAITVASETSAALCIIDCQGDCRGFHFQNGETSLSVLQGFTIRNADLTISYREGGAILCREGSSPSILDCVFQSNSAQSGGAIACRGNANPLIVNCQFVENTALQYGGAIYCPFSVPSISGCTFLENTAESGSSIAFRQSPANVNACSFSGGNWTNFGDLYADVASNPNISQCDFSESSLEFRDSEVTISDCALSSSSMQFDTTTFIMENTMFDSGFLRCRSTSQGSISDSTLCGVKCYQSATLTIHNSTVTGWTGDYGGGVECTDSSYVELLQCLITGNTCERKGGGVTCSGESTAVLSECLVTGNTADEGSGIACSDESQLTIDHCQITDNEGSGILTRGGGVFFAGTSVMISNCVISNNESKLGGGIYISGASFSEIGNCLITGNSAENGGGIALEGMNGAIAACHNCTIADNTALTGSALYGYSNIDGSCLITDGILWNTGESNIDVDAGCFLNINNSCIQNGYPGEGNLDQDPLFTSGINGNYYLSQIASGQTQNSPCLDSGSDLASALCYGPASNASCMDQLTTAINGQLDSGQVDMGYHLPSVVLGVDLLLSRQVFTPGDQFDLTAKIANPGPETYTKQPFVVLLDVGEMFFWYPGWTANFEFQEMDIPIGIQEITLLSFTWPSVQGSCSGLRFYGALLSKDMTSILGVWDSIDFGWAEQ
ncbi:right-handed parallel beta-helix repeat-containing protein [bacterium]|nr:right-handed parallel beta-helix repeat-containing protein [candidate division CSSED10-310 bacterium]